MLMLGAKVMQVKMCYELEEWQALQAILESTRMYLFRRKEEMAKEPFLNFLRIAQKLLQVNLLDATARELMAQEIKSTVPESAWLVARVQL